MRDLVVEVEEAKTLESLSSQTWSTSVRTACSRSWLSCSSIDRVFLEGHFSSAVIQVVDCILLHLASSKFSCRFVVSTRGAFWLAECRRPVGFLLYACRLPL